MTSEDLKQWANSPAGQLDQKILANIKATNPQLFNAILNQNLGVKPEVVNGNYYIPSNGSVDIYREKNTGVQTPISEAGQWWMYENPVKQFKYNHPDIFLRDLQQNGDVYFLPPQGGQ